MTSFRGGGGYASRDGLFSRPSQHDQAEVVIDVESGYDVDGEVEGLRGQVGKLKQMAQAIGQEADHNRKVTESLEDAMENARLALRKGMKKLNRTFKHSKSNHLLFLTVFAFFFFFVLITWTRIVSWLHIS